MTTTGQQIFTTLAADGTLTVELGEVPVPTPTGTSPSSTVSLSLIHI